jgi:hypothetical protein
MALEQHTYTVSLVDLGTSLQMDTKAVVASVPVPGRTR